MDTRPTGRVGVSDWFAGLLLDRRTSGGQSSEVVELTRASGGGARPSVVFLQLPWVRVCFEKNFGRLMRSLLHKSSPFVSFLHPPWVISETSPNNNKEFKESLIQKHNEY